jgi:hypothetical protein
VAGVWDLAVLGTSVVEHLAGRLDPVQLLGARERLDQAAPVEPGVVSDLLGDVGAGAVADEVRGADEPFGDVVAVRELSAPAVLAALAGPFE